MGRPARPEPPRPEPRRPVGAFAPAGVLALAAGYALLAACGHGPEPEVPGSAATPAGRPPNVVLLSVDTLRADHLEPYGYGRRTSPFLAELAAESYLFTDAVAQCGTTPQSLASLMTSRYPYSDRILVNNGPFLFLRPSSRSLAAILGEHGYATHAVTDNVQAGRSTGLDLGFDTFDEVGDRAERGGAEVTDGALRWLRGRAGHGEPFFLWVHYVDPHYPYEPPDGYDGLWPEAEDVPEGERRRYRFETSHSEEAELSDGDVARIVAAYDREVRFTDDCLRRLFEGALEEHLADTLVLFTADHGEGLGEHGLITHNDLFQSVVRVPLLLRLPGTEPPAGRLADPVMLVDVVPTVLDLAGLPPEPRTRGASLRPLLEGRALPPRNRLSEYPNRKAIFGRGHKAVYEVRPDERLSAALYDLGRDPAESTNVASERRQLRTRLLRWSRDVVADPWEPEGEDGPLPEVDPSRVQHLRALGYR